MDTIKIKAFLSAVKYKSLSKAAEEFSYTPSAFSHMADSLEEELGVKILNRTPQGVSLSKEGEALYDKLKKVVEAEKELILSARLLSKEREKTLRIASYSSISEHLLPEILMNFKKENPDIEFSVTVSDGVRELLEKGETDVIFADDVVSSGFLWTPFMEDPYLAVVKSDAFPSKKTVTIEELYPFNYIDHGEQILSDSYNAEKFSGKIVIESPESASVLSLVRQGMGVAFLPALALKNKPQGVKGLRVKEGVFRTIGFGYKDSLKRSGNGKIFIDFLEKVVSGKFAKKH